MTGAVLVSSLIVALSGQYVPTACVTNTVYNETADELPGQLWAYGVAGLVYWPTGQVMLTDAACRDLERLHARRAMIETPTLEEAMAVFTVAHEIGHLLYGRDETLADRYGVAHASFVAYLLGMRGRFRYWVLADLIKAYAPLHGYAMLIPVARSRGYLQRKGGGRSLPPGNAVATRNIPR